MPTLVTGRASDRSGAPAGRLARFCTRSNEYRLAISSGVRVIASRASSSAAKPSSRVAVRAPAISSTAFFAAGLAPPVLASATCSPRATAASQASPRSTSGRSTATAPVSTSAAQSSDCSRKSAPEKQASASPSSYAALPPSVLPWLSGFSTITVTALSAPTRFGTR